MDEQVKLLRQQVAAAEFLLRNLKIQLREAEDRAKQNVFDEARSREARYGSPGSRTPSGNVEQSAHAGHSQIYNSHGHEPASRLPSIDGLNVQRVDSDDDAPAEDNDLHMATKIRLPSIEVGVIYASLEDVKRAATAHAISQGWTVGVHKRDKTRLLLRCRTGNECPFHLRAEQYAEGAKICSLKPEHNCDFQPDQSHVPRSHASSLKFLRQELPNIMTIDANTTSQEISDAIFKRFGTRVSVKQCRQLKPGPKRKRTPTVGTCSRCGAIGHNRKTCGRVTELQDTPSE